MDFFGGQGNTSKGPIIGKVVVKKVVPTPPSRSSGSGSASTSTSTRPTISSRPTSSTSVSKNRPQISSSLSVPNKSQLSTHSSRSSTPNNARRKRTPEPVRSESESESASSSSSSSSNKKEKKKRKRLDDKTISSSLPGTPKFMRKPTSGIQNGHSRPDGTGSLGKRKLWCIDQCDQRGEWDRGWAGFVTCEEAVRGDVKGWAGGKGIAKGSLEKYIPYFPQDGFGNQEPLPSVELVYPSIGCKEQFVLLIPTSPREYNPISELRTVLQTILEHYIPPSHAHIFGSLSESLDLDPLAPLPSRLHSPIPTSSALATPPPDSSSSPTPQRATDTIGDAIRKALAPNRRDGPGLLRAIQRFNVAMEDLQRSGVMKAWLELKRGKMGEGEWSSVVEIVHEQAYSRIVGPYSDQLEHHPKHPDEVARAISGKEDAYGELRHKFMSQIIAETGLTPSSVFVDLGSGVGNCVLQTALQAGCVSLGVELLPVPAHCARLQVAEVKRRWSMWGLNGNLGVEVVEGDFRQGLVGTWLAKADVVLVNNEVFPPSLNDDLKNMFLDLKEGARIVSLKPFVNEGFRMNDSNCDSFDAIVRLSQHSYYNEWVSWKGDSGKYYVQVIDRSMRMKFEEEMKSGRRRR